jgi:uncharacterized peroxidase-related enzyme
MTFSDRFAPLDVESAPPAVRAILQGSVEKFGFLPSPVARAAHAPVLLKHLLAGFAAFEKSSLSELEREVVAMTVAYEVECHYCMAMHSALLSGERESAPLLRALRSGEPLEEGRLESLRRFARSLVRDRGRLSLSTWQELEQAGVTEEQILDVVLGVGVYLLSTLTNVVTAAPLDPAFVAFGWTKPTT